MRVPKPLDVFGDELKIPSPILETYTMLSQCIAQKFTILLDEYCEFL